MCHSFQANYLTLFFYPHLFIILLQSNTLEGADISSEIWFNKETVAEVHGEKYELADKLSMGDCALRYVQFIQ